jgi:hypothetical protein
MKENQNRNSDADLEQSLELVSVLIEPSRNFFLFFRLGTLEKVLILFNRSSKKYSSCDPVPLNEIPLLQAAVPSVRWTKKDRHQTAILPQAGLL